MSKKESQYWIFNHATVHYRKHIHLISFDMFSNPQVNWDEVCLQRKQSQKKVKPCLYQINWIMTKQSSSKPHRGKELQGFFQRSLDSDLTSRNGLSSKRSLSKYLIHHHHHHHLIHHHHYPHNQIILILIQPYNPFIYINTFIGTTILVLLFSSFYL